MLLSFAHIEKTAGSTIAMVLRQSFGSRHLDVLPFYSGDELFGPGDLRKLLSLQPDLASFAGHTVHPHVALETVRPDIRYFTYLREPLARFRSHYQWQIENGRHRLTFEAWLKDAQYANWMVKYLCGREDVDAAYQILKEKMLVVGLIERFDEGLVQLRRAIDGQLPINIHYGPPDNPAKRPDLKRELDEKMKMYDREVREANELDRQLYQRVVDELYPAQTKAYGATLAADTKQFQEENSQVRRPGRFRFNAFKVFVYKPTLIASRLLRRTSLNT